VSNDIGLDQSSAAAGAGAIRDARRGIRMITPAPPGGTTALLAHRISLQLSPAFSHQIVIDNRGGVLAAEFTAKAAPVGHALLMTYSQQTTNVSLSAKSGYRAPADDQPIVHVPGVPLVLETKDNLPGTSVPEIISYGKANPGELNFSSAGNRSTGLMSLQLFIYMAKTTAQHIPYYGLGPSLADLPGGSVQARCIGIPQIPPLPHSGRVRPPAVTSAKHAAALPELPIIAETGITGYEMVTGFGVLTPAGVARPFVNRLNADTVQVLRTRQFEQGLTGEGAQVIAGTTDAFEKKLTRGIGEAG
jgi:tripartite-type tricarboxylate transporter receptor subunit TctC